jgi:hypothetical protein
LKVLRKRLTWILLLALILLPVLVSCVWYGLQVRQQRLDHALIKAIKKRDTGTAISLLDQGADANATDKPEISVTLKSMLDVFWSRLKGNAPSKDTGFFPSALLSLYWNGEHSVDKPLDNPALVGALLDHGANHYPTDKFGFTVLHYACRDKHDATVKVLLEHHINPNPRDNQSRTPLMFADDVSTLLLIQYGADVNAQDSRGSTALSHFVSMVMFPERGTVKVRLLIQHGAKVSLRDRSGKTALDYAKEYGFKEAIPLLEEALKREQAE